MTQIIKTKFYNKASEEVEEHRFFNINTLQKFSTSMCLPWGSYQRIAYCEHTQKNEC